MALEVKDPVANTVNQANQAQASQGLIVQSYCTQMLQQPEVNFAGTPNLITYQTSINDGLKRAKGNATYYLNTVQPMIIRNVANLDAYCDLYKAVPIILPEGSSQKDWSEVLNAMKDQSQTYKDNANEVVRALQGLTTKLGGDSAFLIKTVGDLNNVVGGDNGVLAEIDKQLGTIESQIGGAIAGIVVSGLAIIGGVFITAVGAIASFVTAGTSAPLALLGVGIIAAGVGGTVASSIVLSKLLDAKGELLTKQVKLKAEVQLATGIKDAYSGLSQQASAAITATTQMANAWTGLELSLGTMISNLDKGITSPSVLRRLFLAAANESYTTVKQDVTTIKLQMAGVQTKVAPQGVQLGTYMRTLLPKAA
jgi:non-hemolytic enterotoxin B/C